MAALDAAMDGTVNCAKRDDGRVLRTGMPVAAASAEAAAAAATAAAGAAAGAGAALAAVRAADFTGAPPAAAALAALAVLVVALDLLGSAFNSCLLTVHIQACHSALGGAGGRVGGKPLC